MALDASKNNRASKRESSVIIYSDVYTKGSLTEEEIATFMSFENFLIDEFLKLTRAGKTKKINSFKKQYLDIENKSPIDDKHELFEQLSQSILQNKSKYKYDCIKHYEEGVSIYYYIGNENGTPKRLELKKSEHIELEKILNLKPEEMEKELITFKENNNLSKKLLEKINIAINILSDKNK